MQVPQNYLEWRKCIEVDCGILLSIPYCEQRIAKLSDKNDRETQRFLQLYGQEHTENILTWFKKYINEN